MANIMDYLDWRGDLPLTVSPFNEVDGLILAELSFINFEGIVPPPELGRGVPLLRDAAGTYFARHNGQEIDMGRWSRGASLDLMCRHGALRALRRDAAERLLRADGRRARAAVRGADGRAGRQQHLSFPTAARTIPSSAGRRT